MGEDNAQGDADSVEAAASLARDVHTIGVQLLKQDAKRTGGHAVISMMVARALNAMDSVQLLTENGHTTDAYSVMRSICELAIDVAYICKDDFAARSNLFFNHVFVARHRILRALGADSVRAEHAGDIALIYEHVRGHYPNKSSWTVKSIKMRADETGKSWLYDLGHRIGSGASHSCAESLMHEIDVVMVNDAPVLKSKVGVYTDRDGTPLNVGALALLDLILSAAAFLTYDIGDAVNEALNRSHMAARFQELTALPPVTDE